MTADTQGPTPFAVVSKDGIGCTQVGFRCADGESASYFPCVTAHMTAADLNAAVAARERAAEAKALREAADAERKLMKHWEALAARYHERGQLQYLAVARAEIDHLLASEGRIRSRADAIEGGK